MCKLHWTVLHKESTIPDMDPVNDRVLIIGAGIGGLAAAVRLAAAGRRVEVLERHDWIGGKMRTLPSDAGPVDAGPTVLTMRGVFDDLFALAGTRLADHVTLQPLPVLARHFWSDGTRLDLVADAATNRAAISAALGAQAGADFARFEQETHNLFNAFDAPIMRAPVPSVIKSARSALRAQGALPWLIPGRKLDTMLRARLREPKLQQLFGRYATYVGGNPLRAPAVLGLIWQAEAAGVWAVKGGMAALARALLALLERLGGQVHTGTEVAKILSQGGQIRGVLLADGTRMACAQVIHNGDPAALSDLLDTPPLRRQQTQPRSLSAQVWTLAATVQSGTIGPRDLAYHNVFFADDPAQEFGPLARGQTPEKPTIYVCAQDRATRIPQGRERFQFILNAPPLPHAQPKDRPCPLHPFDRLAQFGLTLTPRALETAQTLTQPQDFAALFPASQGALYGLSPDGAMATFQRPVTRTRVRGLYLAGGGVHPGAGVPMAAMSGMHAAAAALSDRISVSGSRPMAMRGGISTGSAIAGRAPSRSSRS
jgi:1-hydroxycarotenoid 3,4-desaturase